MISQRFPSLLAVRDPLQNFTAPALPLSTQSRRQFLTTAAGATMALAGGLVPLVARAAKPDQKPGQFVDPRDLLLNIPSGPIRPGDNRNVECLSPTNTQIVARLHVEVGDTRVVMLPGGHLITKPMAETTVTDKPFNPATPQQVAAELSGGPFSGFRSRITRRYLYLYNTSDAFYTAASRIMETMYPGLVLYARGQKITVHDPDVPLVVIMFRTEAEFQDYQRMPAGVVAYYSPVSNYVVMYEHSRLSQIAPDIAMHQAIATIAHEGAHQILHNIGVQQRLSRWPLWICEGLAEYFAPTTTDKRMNWKGAGQLNEMRLMELDQYLRTRTRDAHGDLVNDTVEAANLTSIGYAAAWALTHFLVQKQAPKFFKFLNEVSRLAPLEGATRPDREGRIADNRAMFIKYFSDNTDAIEDQVVQHLQKLLAKS